MGGQYMNIEWKMKYCGLVLTASSLWACSHVEPAKVSETANPSVEISQLEAEQSEALRNQLDVLSPKYYEGFANELNTAKEKRAKGKSNDSILKSVAQSRGYLEEAKKVQAEGAPALRDVLQARSDALAADVKKNYPSEFDSTEKEFKKVTKDVENNDFKPAEKKRAEFVQKYLDLELKSVKKEKLAYAKQLVQQAKDEGAEKEAPKTLRETQAAINSADAVITVDRRNTYEVEKTSGEAVAQAKRLLRITREAKTMDKKDGEEIALAKEANLVAVHQLEKKNQSLTREQMAARTYDYAFNQFSGDEAQVLRDKNRIIVRLSGLHFKAGETAIAPEDYRVMNKLQDVIRRSGEGHVVVEGHTDSTGSSLKNRKVSEGRATAVKEYLVANRVLSEDHLEAVGYGASKPLALNNNEKNRKKNRRVDVIIEPTQMSPAAE